MMVKCPRGLSGVAFAWALEEERVMVVPGEIMGLPGHIRLSLTCSDAMVDYALPVFERLLKKWIDYRNIGKDNKLIYLRVTYT